MSQSQQIAVKIPLPQGTSFHFRSKGETWTASDSNTLRAVALGTFHCNPEHVEAAIKEAEAQSNGNPV